MGWASGTNFKGRTIGYSHAGVCEEPGCDNPIDLGLSYCCGGLDGVNGEAGCGDYFCGEHLWYAADEDVDGPRCARCLASLAESGSRKRNSRPSRGRLGR